MRTPTTPDDLRRWVENQRAAADREGDEALRTGYVDDPVAAGLELMILAGGLYGWPIPKDDFQEREDEAAREAWRRLRERLGKR